MPILLDREHMCVRYRHVNENALLNIMAIEFTHTAVVYMSENMIESYSRFTDYELKMLYTNMCGQKYQGYSRDILMTTVMHMVQSLPSSELNGFELAIQAAKITIEDDGFYRYAKGSQSPERVNDRYLPPALVAVVGYVPAPTPNNTASAAPAHHTQAASVPAQHTKPQSVTLPAEAPKAGSKTGRVWEIAETVLRQKLEAKERDGGQLDVKALRKNIVELCEAEGINSSTASVQYGKWKTTKVF